jgi:hypothetical protein
MKLSAPASSTESPEDQTLRSPDHGEKNCTTTGAVIYTLRGKADNDTDHEAKGQSGANEPDNPFLVHLPSNEDGSTRLLNYTQSWELLDERAGGMEGGRVVEHCIKVFGRGAGSDEDLTRLDVSFEVGLAELVRSVSVHSLPVSSEHCETDS